MIKNKKVTCVVPARLESTRFPKKVLARLGGKPILQWVFEAARLVDVFGEIIFAIDSQETADVIKSFGGNFCFTSQECKTGTDRLVEVFKKKSSCRLDHPTDIWVNWQADEPFVSPDMITTLLSSCGCDEADVWTLKKKIADSHSILCPNTVKVVCDLQDYALYFSRSPIPFYRDEDGIGHSYYKHIGLFAYSSAALKKISSLNDSFLETAEKLEQLRFLQNRLKIRVHETDREVVGIDTAQDLERAEKLLKMRKNSFSL
jgi:3-deoxy-manno-octulosonate cytidylyltransferase (CMP-KDO synthetase)